MSGEERADVKNIVADDLGFRIMKERMYRVFLLMMATTMMNGNMKSCYEIQKTLVSDIDRCNF